MHTTAVVQLRGLHASLPFPFTTVERARERRHKGGTAQGGPGRTEPLQKRIVPPYPGQCWRIKCLLLRPVTGWRFVPPASQERDGFPERAKKASSRAHFHSL